MGLMNMQLTDMTLVQMSFSAAVMILAITVVRALAINKLPKKVFVFLWEVVLLRLLIPFSIPSMFSAYTFMRRNEPLQDALTDVPAMEIVTQVTVSPVNAGVNAGTVMPTQSGTVDFPIMTIVWIVGMLLCAAYFAVSYLRCHLEFQTSLPVKNEFAVRWLRRNKLKRTIQIRQSDRILAPLTYGIRKPVILMPKKTDWENPQQLEYVLLHEYTHIRRFDMVVKLIAALALCIHWFNPFAWAMYILFNRDLELSCDECVVRQFGENSKSVYAQTLITMEEKKSGLTPLYNSFSRNAIEERITAIMKIKKVTIGILVLSVFVILAIVVPFATSAKEQSPSDSGADGVDSSTGIIYVSTEEADKMSEIASEDVNYGEAFLGGIDVPENVLEIAREVVLDRYDQMQEDGAKQWEIRSLEHVYTYDDLEERTVEIYQMHYAFLLEDPENVTLAGGMTIDEEGWVVPEYPGSTYLCLVADGGSLSYVVLMENDCFPGDEVFTEDLMQALGIEATAEDHYQVATSLSAGEVEQFAMGVKNDVLNKNWVSLSEKIVYPITINGITLNDGSDFLELDFDGNLNQEFVDAVAAESCRKMFCNWQGIMMGTTGQIWLSSVDDGSGVWELKIIGINDMLNVSEEQKVETLVLTFAQAYFEGDQKEVQQFLSASYERDLEVYSGTKENVQINAVKGLADVTACEVGDVCEVSVEFKESAEADHYVYLTITLEKEADGWKVSFYGLEG